MATFTVGVTGIDKVLERMKTLPARLDEAEKRAVVRGQLHTERKWKENVRGLILNVRTGAYRASVRSGAPEKDARGHLGRVGIVRGKAEKYAPVHEYGATIRPKPTNKRGRLAFRIPGVGWRSATSVTIPARAPMARSFEAVRPQILSEFETLTRRAINAGR